MEENSLFVHGLATSNALFQNDPRKAVGSGFWLSLVFTFCVIPCSIIIAYCAAKTYRWFKCTININTSRRLLHIRIFYLLILQVYLSSGLRISFFRQPFQSSLLLLQLSVQQSWPFFPLILRTVLI